MRPTMFLWIDLNVNTFSLGRGIGSKLLKSARFEPVASSEVMWANVNCSRFENLPICWTLPGGNEMRQSVSSRRVENEAMWPFDHILVAFLTEHLIKFSKYQYFVGSAAAAGGQYCSCHQQSNSVTHRPHFGFQGGLVGKHMFTLNEFGRE